MLITAVAMVVPKDMVWAFEGKAEAMEEHCKSLEDVIEFAGSLDIPSLRYTVVKESGKAMVLWHEQYRLD